MDKLNEKQILQLKKIMLDLKKLSKDINLGVIDDIIDNRENVDLALEFLERIELENFEK